MENYSEEKEGKDVFQSPYSADLEAILAADLENIEAGLKKISATNNRQAVNGSANRAPARRYSAPTSVFDAIYQDLERASEGAYNALSNVGGSLKEKTGDVYENYFVERKPVASFYQTLKNKGNSLYGSVKRLGKQTKTRAANRMYKLFGKEAPSAKVADENVAVSAEEPEGLDIIRQGSYNQNENSDGAPRGVNLLEDDELLGANFDALNEKDINNNKRNTEKYKGLSPIKRVRLPNKRMGYFIQNGNRAAPYSSQVRGPLPNSVSYSFTMSYGNRGFNMSYTVSAGFGISSGYAYTSN